MSSRWAEFLRIPAGMVELGLATLDNFTRIMRNGLDTLVPPKLSLARDAPPIHGPQDLDTALADFANQIVRIGWVTLPQGVPLNKVASDIVKSARRAFGYLDFADPRTLTVPFAMPFSATGIAAETLLRMIAIYSVVGRERLKAFLSNAAEVYCETAIFIGLEYKESSSAIRSTCSGTPMI